MKLAHYPGVVGFAKLSPETVKGYGGMGSAGQKTGQLDPKTREPIAVAITLRRDGRIAVHADTARKLGATQEKIAAALGVAVGVNAGAAIVYSTRAGEPTLRYRPASPEISHWTRLRRG